MPSGAEWLIFANLAIYVLAAYGLLCVFRAFKRRRRSDGDRFEQPTTAHLSLRRPRAHERPYRPPEVASLSVLDRRVMAAAHSEV